MPKTYYQIPEGSGDVFTFPIQGINTNACTINCENCVGVYIPLSDNKCFAAHIYTWIDPADQQAPEHDFEEWVPEGDKGKRLTEKIVALLEQRVRQHMPSKEELSRRAHDAVVVCPRSQEESEDAVGTYVIDGLQQFFGIPLSCKSAHGFVVEHSTQDVQLFRFCNMADGARRNSFDFDVKRGKDIEPKSDGSYGWSGTEGRSIHNWRLNHYHGEWKVHSELLERARMLDG